VQGPNGIPEPELETRLFKFIPADRSHPPVFAKAFNSCPQQLGDMNDAFTWLSHNMSAEDFKREVLAKVPGTTLETWMVTYFYKKV